MARTVKKNTPERTQQRKDVTSLSELKGYLLENSRSELPFSQEIWELAQEKAKEQNEINKKDLLVDDGTGRMVFNGRASTSKKTPIEMYFKLVNIPSYQKKIESQIAEFKAIDELKFREDVECLVEDSWLHVFLESYNENDQKFLKERLNDYYDNYEINEGADKTLVISAVADELEIIKLTSARNKRNSDSEDKLKKVKDSFLKTLDGLKALKKQRGKADEGKNKLTQWIDDMEKNGDFTYKFEEYDQIDEMIDVFRKGIMETYKGE